MKERREGGRGRERREGERGRERREGDNKPFSNVAKKQLKHKGHVTSHSMSTRSSNGAGGMPVHHIVLPALLLGGVAVVVYFGEAWWMGSGVNKPLPLPTAVSDTWRNDNIYHTRLWGTYR